MNFSHEQERAFAERVLRGETVSTADAAAADAGPVPGGRYEFAISVRPDAVTMSAPLDGADGWRVVVELHLVDDEVRPGRLVVEPGEAKWPSSDVMKRLRLRDLWREAQRELQRPAAVFALPVEWVAATVKPPRPGQAGRDLRFYAIWAELYVDALATAPQAPTKYLAERYGLTQGSVRAFVNKARARGLLTGAEPGRAGGDLTPEAVRLLEGLTADKKEALIRG